MKGLGIEARKSNYFDRNLNNKAFYTKRTSNRSLKNRAKIRTTAVRVIRNVVKMV